MPVGLRAIKGIVCPTLHSDLRTALLVVPTSTSLNQIDTSKAVPFPLDSDKLRHVGTRTSSAYQFPKGSSA